MNLCIRQTPYEWQSPSLMNENAQAIHKVIPFKASRQAVRKATPIMSQYEAIRKGPPPLMNDNAQTIHKMIAVIKEFRDAIHKAIGKCCKANPSMKNKDIQ